MAFPAQLASLTGELVEAITSITTQTANARFEALRESSLRTLRQHSFLRTNQFEVYSALDGYEERFRVQNRDRVADALRDRLAALASCSSRWTPDILDLLLKLADQPVQKSNLDHLALLKKKDKSPEPTLKWSDIAKEDGWDGDGELWLKADFGGYSSDDDYVGYETDASARSGETSSSSIETRHNKRPADYIESLQSPLDLNEIRKSQAWRHQRVVGKSIIRTSKISITEAQFIREILFMLAGLENGLLDRQGKPLPDFQLAHASWPIFRSLLVSAHDAGRILIPLRQFVEQQEKIPLLQVFRVAIQNRLRSFDSTLASMQAYYTNTSHDLVVSVVKLLDDLGPHLHPFNFITRIIEQLEQSQKPASFYFLELLFDSAQALQLDGDEHAYRFIGQFFFECFAVYLRPIRRWMRSGELSDNDDASFFISRSALDVPRSQVWVDQFILKETSQGSLFAPRFLQPAASKIFTAGKSIVILKLLGKNWPMQEEQPEHTIQVDMNAISDFVPFPEVFRNMFDEWMLSKHHAASATLRQTLFQTYSFWSDLDVLQYLYLMSDGSRSERFADAVFNNLDLFNPDWHNRFNLTEIAREAFGNLIESHRLNVSTSWDNSTSDVKFVRRTVREGLPLIRITYQLPWVSRIVLTDESLNQYQQIFTFLLQLRRASKVLTSYRILSDGLTHTSEKGIFYGVRSKLLWFCNTLQSYISALVLGPLVASFREQMRQAEDIDEMLTSHSAFTKQMINEVCLGSKLDPIRQGILDVFDLALKLRDAHQMELERVADESQELTRQSVMSSPRKDGPGRYIKISEEEDETFLGEQDTSAMAEDTEATYSQILIETRSALDRHLKFICGGLRGVSRASSSAAASKWEILAEMLEAGIQGL